MFEREYMTGHEQDWPSIFDEIAAGVTGVAAIDVRDAVLAAFMAAEAHDTPEERQTLYRKMLYYIVEEYANSLGLPPDRVSDALVAAAQSSEPIKEELELKRRR